jgi:ribosomal protein S18 acetylase RimI-like enzyme
MVIGVCEVSSRGDGGAILVERITVRAMRAADLNFAAQCAMMEGWASETRTEFEGFCHHDPDGCLIAEADGTPIGIAVATDFGGAGFIGEVIVLAAWRGRGVGRRLVDQAMVYLHECGAHSIYLDGVVKAVSLYERAGFRRVCRSKRFYGWLTGRTSPEVRPMRAEDMETVSTVDRQAFGADRQYFLQRRLALYPELCKVMEQGGEMTGYIFGRRGYDVIGAGPWWVREDAARPEDLLYALAAEAGNTLIGIGVLETNARAVDLLRSLGLDEHPTPPWRMVSGVDGRLGAAPELYANGTSAKG